MSRRSMPVAVADRFTTDVVSARDAARAGDDGAAWALLEEAHVLSQPWAWPHVKVHAAMLALGWRTRDRREVRGQLLRIVVAGPGSMTGRYPEGNTGRSSVSAAQPMPIPDDLRTLLGVSDG